MAPPDPDTAHSTASAAPTTTSNTYYLPPYEALTIRDDPTMPQVWLDWKEGLEALLDAMPIPSSEQTNRRSKLLHYIGKDGRKLFKKLDDTGASYDSAIKAFDTYFCPTLNRIYLMHQLSQIRQTDIEPMDTFSMRVKEKVTDLNLTDLTKDGIIELITLAQLVNFTKNSALRRKVLKDSLSLKDFLKDARSYEQASYQAQEIQEPERRVFSVQENEYNEESDEGNLCRVTHFDSRRGRSQHRGQHQRYDSSYSRPNFNQNRQRPTSPYHNTQQYCYRCGAQYPHPPGKQCPAEKPGTICSSCTRPGHFSSVCKSAGRGNQRSVSISDNADTYNNQYRTNDSTHDNYVILPSIRIGSLIGNRKTTEVYIQEKSVEFIIDSGAEVNTMNTEDFKTLNLPILPATYSLYAYGPKEQNQLKLPTMGRVKVQLTSPVTNKTVTTEIHVIQGKRNEVENLLSCTTSESLGLIQFAKPNRSHSEPPRHRQTSTTVHAISIDARNKMDSIIKEYKDRFEGIGQMKGVKIQLQIDESVPPVIQNFRPTPFHLREEVDKELDRLTELGIIEPAKGPTKWMSPTVTIQKENGVRICIDSRAINKAILRERFPMPTIDDLIVQLNGAKFFSKIDLVKAFHQLTLDEACRYITTFATHKGPMQYKRLNFGINSASELFQRAISWMLQGKPNQVNLSDDIIIYTQTVEEQVNTVKAILQRMREYNVTAGKDKCEFLTEEIDFYGHKFSANGVSPQKSKVEAILDATPPTCISELKSLLGMAQYVSRFICNYSTIVAPLRKLCRQDAEWIWDAEVETAFQELKLALAEDRAVSYFDTSLPTTIIVDASPVGLGAVLTQQKPNGEINVVSYASRALSDVESRYSQTEREFLGVVWACEKLHVYIYGTEITIVTDHKPLLGITNKTTARHTARIEKLCLRLQPYKMKMIYQPGKDNTADYLSRHPGKSQDFLCSQWIEDEIESVCINALKCYKIPDGVCKEDIREATSKDDKLQKLQDAIIHQTVNRLDNEQYQAFKHVKDELCVQNGLILRGNRIVIPEILQNKIIDIAHRSHQGMVKTKNLLRATVWFPKLDALVERAVRDCLPCQSATHVPPKQEPLIMTELPEEPWKSVSVDFCGPFEDRGDYLLVMIDDYSRFPEVEIVSSTSFDAVVPHLDAIFSRQGVPDVVKTDNGPPFNSNNFKLWAKALNFEHRKIQPLWPRANGEAERFMRTLEKFIRAVRVEKGDWRQELYRFLRHYRATPHTTTGVSPAKLLNGRQLKTELPTETSDLPEHSDTTKKVRFADEIIMRNRDKRLKEYMKSLADERNRARESNLKIGDSVLIKEPKTNKYSTPFKPVPYKIININGSMVTAKSKDDHMMTRNSSLLKLIEDTCGKDKVYNNRNVRNETNEEEEIIFDSRNQVIHDQDDPPVQIQNNPPVQVQNVQNNNIPNERPMRERRFPDNKYKDFHFQKP